MPLVPEDEKWVTNSVRSERVFKLRNSQPPKMADPEVNALSAQHAIERIPARGLELKLQRIRDRITAGDATLETAAEHPRNGSDVVQVAMIDKVRHHGALGIVLQKGCFPRAFSGQLGK